MNLLEGVMEELRIKCCDNSDMIAVLYGLWCLFRSSQADMRLMLTVRAEAPLRSISAKRESLLVDVRYGLGAYNFKVWALTS